MSGSVTVRVPATSANLGPGFDAFGLALGLYNTFTARLSDTWAVEIEGVETAHLQADETNPVARAMRAAFERAGCAGRAAQLLCANEIPTGRGLGSSAAAIVGGLALGNALCDGRLDRDELFALAAEIEGHPDNVASALYGGFTISMIDEGGPKTFGIPGACGLAAVTVISRSPFRTKRARRLLPEKVTHADAAFNAGRAGMVAAGIATGDERLVAAGLHDRLHEHYRASAIEGFADVTAALREAGATGAVLSGAGPTVLGVVMGVDDDVALERAREIADDSAKRISATGAYRSPVALPVERGGTTVVAG